MGWESRDGVGRYYTRSRRICGRVVREYVGCGALAQAVAHLDATRRAENRLAKERDQAQRQAELDLHTSLRGLCSKVSALMADALSEAGYHEHRGQWRRRRQ